MTTSVSFQFHDSEIRILTGFVLESPPQAITAITAASPPVVTSNAHGLTDGDIVRITGVVGPDELNDQLFVVLNAATNTFQLADADASEYDAYVSGGIVATASLLNFCELTTYSRTGGSKPEENITSLCSEAQDFSLGLPDFGTSAIEYLWAPNTTIQTALREYDASGDLMAVKVVLPGSGGTMVQFGRVQSTSETAGTGSNTWRASATIRNTGQPVYIEAEV